MREKKTRVRGWGVTHPPYSLKWQSHRPNTVGLAEGDVGFCRRGGRPAAEAQTTRAATSAAARDPRRVASVARGRRNKHPRSRDADDWRTCRTSKSAPPGTTTGGLACQSTKTTGVGAR